MSKPPKPPRIGPQAGKTLSPKVEQLDAFGSTTATIQAKEEDPAPIETQTSVQGRGRPKKYEVNKHKTTVTFELTQIVSLDRICTDILANTGRIVDRGDIIRAAVEAVLQSGLDFSSVDSVERIREMLTQRLT